MADVSKIQLPNNTVLNIKDSRISDVGAFVQKSGGSMSDDASLTFNDSSGDYETTISPGAIVLKDWDNSSFIAVDTQLFGVSVYNDENDSQADKTVYSYGLIYNKPYNGSQVQLTLPTTAGTLALTSQIPDTSTLLPKSGGTMDAQATLTFTDSDGLYTVEIEHEGIIVMDDDDGFSVSIDASLPSVTIFEGIDYTEYRCGQIRYGSGNNNYDTFYFPSASGTLALTSDVPTVEALTTSEIDSIWTNAS